MAIPPRKIGGVVTSSSSATTTTSGARMMSHHHHHHHLLTIIIGVIFLLLLGYILGPNIANNYNISNIKQERIKDRWWSSSASSTSPAASFLVDEPPSSFQIHPHDCEESPLHTRALPSTKSTKLATWSHNQPLRKPQDFYNNAHWPPSELSRTSTSGEGSDRGPATENSLAIIVGTIEKYNVTSMIDIPCGDMNWIMDSYVTDTLPVYIGLDITSNVIELNKLRFGHHVNKHFYFWDAASCALPKFRDNNMMRSTGAAEAAVVRMDEDDGDEIKSYYKPVDLVHVRDVIQHLSLAQGVQFFCNVFRSGARVLITTTYNDASSNQDIGEGGWYQNNLRLEPFSFPEIGDCVHSHPDIEPDFTCVYDLTEAWVGEFVATKCSL